MRYAVLIVLFLLASCEYFDNDIRAAESNVRKHQKDPEAAQFREVEHCPKSSSYVTGEVNGKNSYGAYGGFKRFYANEYSVHVDGQPDFETGNTAIDADTATDEDHSSYLECFEGKSSTGSYSAQIRASAASEAADAASDAAVAGSRAAEPEIDN